SFAEGWRPLAAFADERARELFVALIVVGLAAMINPSGPLLFHNVLAFGGSGAAQTSDEFQPLNLSLGPLALAFYVLAAVVLLTTWGLARKLPSATGVVLILVFGLVPMLRRRFLVWWMPLVPLLVVPIWADWLKRWLEKPELPGEPNFRKTVMVGLV